MLSLRVSVHRTARSRRAASQSIRISSVLTSFAPKPPPTSGLMMRIWDGSSAIVWAIALQVDMRRLRGEPRRDPSVRSARGDGRARLERAGRHALADERARDDDVAAVEERVVVRRATRRVPRRSCRLGEEQHLVGECLLRGDGDRQRVVVDEDELRRVGAGRAGLARARSRRSRRRSARRHLRSAGAPSPGRGPGTAAARTARSRDPRPSAPGCPAARRGRGVDGDPRVREQRPDEGDVQRALERHVLDVLLLPRRKRSSSFRSTRVVDGDHRASL